MIEVVPFEMKHFDQIELRELDKVTTQGFLETLQKNVEHAGPAYTGLVDGEVVAIAGVVLLWPGVAEGWVFGSPKIAKYKKSFCRHVRNKLAEIEKEHKLWRVQATIVSGWSGLMRFVEFLGFQFEGRLSQYGLNKEDYLMYARLHRG
jgi:hypothetical protein